MRVLEFLQLVDDPLRSRVFVIDGQLEERGVFLLRIIAGRRTIHSRDAISLKASSAARKTHLTPVRFLPPSDEAMRADRKTEHRMCGHRSPFIDASHSGPTPYIRHEMTGYTIRDKALSTGNSYFSCSSSPRR
ncbi:hypothetical protein CEXT_401731 [Caerostris extrusa]|uniref:Uncharacterized protein n=1 Tax=Caerostris extrusa TaxID=172846 RepID=A0AAV4RFN5_CAEEX|nr:hypothetical protein CEXT_401731 [Caerostris extrusa]